MADNKIYSNEESLRIIANQIGSLPLGDCWRVKLKRKNGSGMGILNTHSHIATLDGAVLLHLASPELWIPKLCGGGHYLMTILPAHDPTHQIGSDISFSYGNEPTRDIDFAAVKAPDWKGPSELIWPEPPKKVEQLPPSLVSMAPSTPSQMGGNAANVTPSAAGVLGGAVSPYGSFGMGSAEAALMQREREILDREARIREEAIRRENELAIQKLKMDMELERARIQAQIEQGKAEARVAEQARAVQAAQPSILVQLIPALAPVLQAILQQGQDMRLAMMKQQEAVSMQQQNLLQVILARPAIDPTMEKLVERMSQPQGGTTSEMIHTMTDSMSNMIRMTSDVLNVAAEAGLGGGKSESVGLMVVKELSRAIESFGMAGAKALAPPAQSRQIPQPRPLAPGNGAVVPPGASQLPSAAESFVHFDTVSQALEHMIRNRYADLNYVTTFCVQNIGDPTLQQEARQAGGLIELLQARLGNWIDAEPANRQYIETLLTRVTAGLQQVQAAQARQQGQVAPVQGRAQPAQPIQLVQPMVAEEAQGEEGEEDAIYEEDGDEEGTDEAEAE